MKNFDSRLDRLEEVFGEEPCPECGAQGVQVILRRAAEPEPASIPGCCSTCGRVIPTVFVNLVRAENGRPYRPPIPEA